MPSEQEELRLTITLNDQATAGLQALRTNFQNTFSTSNLAQLEKFKKINEDTSKQIKELTNAMLGGQQAMVGYIGKWGLFGFAAAKGIELMIQFAGRLQDTARLAENLGRSFESVHDSIRQFEAGGVSVDKARQAIANLNDAVVELNRQGSPTRAHVLDMFGPQATRGLQEYITQMARAKDSIAQARLASELADRIEEGRYQRELQRGRSPIEARTTAVKDVNDFLREQLHVDREDIRKAASAPTVTPSTPEQIEAAKKAAESSKEATKALGRAYQEMGDAAERAFGTINKGLDDLDRRYNDFRQRGIGTWWKEWFQSITPGSHAAPGADQPLRFSGGEGFGKGWDDMRPSTNIEDVRGRTDTLELNTKQLARLNDNIEHMLLGDDKLGGGGRFGLFSGGTGGGGGFGPGAGGGGGLPGGGGGAPYGSSVGPGTGAGAGASLAGATGGGHGHRHLGGSPFGPGGGTFPRIAGGGAAGAVGGGGGSAPGGGPVSAGPGGRVDAGSLFQSYVSKFRGSSLDGFVPEDGAKFGITKGTPEEWARLATATSMQESSLNARAGGGGLNQFESADLARYGVHGAVNDPNAQTQALVNQWTRSIPNDKRIAGPGVGRGRGQQFLGASRYFGSFREGWNAPGRTDVLAHMKAAGAIAAAGSSGDAKHHPRRLADLHGGASDTGYTGVGGFNFMGSERARAMGLTNPTLKRFATGIESGGPASITANQYAGQDIAGFLKDLHDAGAPLGNYAGVYANKPGQHGLGNAVDIETGFGSGPDNSPALYKWAQEHPQQFAEIQARHHMRNLLNTGRGGAAAHDWGHFEWTPTGRGTRIASDSAGLHAGAMAAAEAARRSIDSAQTMRHQVEGTGKISVDVNAPANTHVRALGGGLFKKTEVNRQVAMQAAHPGSGIAAVPGHGSPL